ncbi:MAG: hypothetical protein HDT37_09995, partial [Clostridiales bacterium]|nr:hypothetical protein [Clostridiales bacterium]
MISMIENSLVYNPKELDPDAVGVLPVCLGKATKLCSLLTDQEKTYQAV